MPLSLSPLPPPLGGNVRRIGSVRGRGPEVVSIVVGVREVVAVGGHRRLVRGRRSSISQRAVRDGSRGQWVRKGSDRGRRVDQTWWRGLGSGEGQDGSEDKLQETEKKKKRTGCN